MHKFLNFENFLLEKMGVPTPMLSYAKTLTSKVLEILETPTEVSNSMQRFAEAFGISIPMESEVDVSGNEEKLLWKVFLTVTTNIVNDGELKKEIGNPIVVEGSSSGFQKIDKPSTTITINITAEDGIVRRKAWKNYEKLITSTILHELTHVYEDMLRKKHGSSISGSRDKAFDVISNIVRSRRTPDYITEFFYLIYLEASYEVNARIAQVYSLIEGEKDREKKLKIIKKSLPWKSTEKLIAWNVKDFIASCGEINFNNRDLTDKEKAQIIMNDIDKFVTMMTPSLIDDFKSEIIVINPTNVEQFIDDVSKNIARVEKIFKKDVFAQLNYWENAFHKAGEKSKRKMLKMISYDEE